MQKFYVNNLITKYIKALLLNTPIPTVPVFSDEDAKQIAGFYNRFYIYNDKIRYCYKQRPTDASEQAVVHEIPYIFGKNYAGITTTFNSRTSHYDSETHYYLGEYVRSYSKIMNIDLLPFYNCFDANYATDISITSNGSTYSYTKGNQDLTVTLVPVKLGKTYTIAFDCPTALDMGLIVYNKFGKISDSNIENSLSDSQYHLASCGFNRPFCITTPALSNNINTFQEKNLKLLIQYPKNNTSSLVILEGDYRDSKLFEHPAIKVKGSTTGAVTTQIVPSKTSYLTLLETNDSNMYPFSDRLLEYLLGNVIDSADTISENIKYIQTAAKNYSDSKYNITGYKGDIDGIWTDTLQQYLFNAARYSTKQNVKYDVLGNADKDVEALITKK